MLESDRQILRKDESGFSLVEMMICVAIIAIGSTLAVPAFQGWDVAAKRAEGFTKINHFANLAAIYKADTGKVPSAAEITFGAGAFIVKNAAACNVRNVFGFVEKDCTNFRYTINYAVSPDGKSWRVQLNNRAHQVCTTQGRDILYGWSSGRKCALWTLDKVCSSGARNVNADCTDLITNWGKPP